MNIKNLKRFFSTQKRGDNQSKKITLFGTQMRVNNQKLEKIKVGIIGCGVIGGALITWLEKHNPNVVILKVDPQKGFKDELSKANLFFINIHLPSEKDGSQDLTILKKIIRKLPKRPIFIRTTVLPNTCDALAAEFNREIYFMPEFLREKNANDDFAIHPMIFCGYADLLSKIFVGKKYVVMSNLEAELTKYAYNVFGALKVTYFNGIYELAQKYHCDYEHIRRGILLNGCINVSHTMVPGPDRLYGYGGKCFPKDVNAFAKFIKGSQLEKIVALLPEINDQYRNQ